MRQPDLSVVVVTPQRFGQLRRTVRHLREQSVAHRTELVVVCPSEDAVADHEPGELDGFAGVEVVPVGPIPNVDKASAHGAQAARSNVVAMVEDHAFVQPGWAEAIVAAHRSDREVVGARILNANPQRMLSWVNILVAYGPWNQPERASGPIDCLPGHNVTYKRDVLVDYGPGLADKLGRDGGLLHDLAVRGARFGFQADAAIAHVNPSTLRSTIDLRFNAGRLYGATRAATEGWSAARRLLYTLGGPLIPAVRFKRFHNQYFDAGRRREIAPRVFPALALGLLLDGLGQMAGYAAGPGGSIEMLATFEMDRLQHITPKIGRA